LEREREREERERETQAVGCGDFEQYTIRVAFGLLSLAQSFFFFFFFFKCYRGEMAMMHGLLYFGLM